MLSIRLQPHRQGVDSNPDNGYRLLVIGYYTFYIIHYKLLLIINYYIHHET